MTSSRFARRARSGATRGITTPEMEIYAYAEKTGALTRLTNARGYDAEASYSPDGQWIVFSSMRDAYNRTLNEQEKKQLETDPSFFAEIYIMKADGSGQTQADQRQRLRRRPVLFTRRQADRLAPLRRAGPDRRCVDDEPRRHESTSDHGLQVDELGAVHSPVG